MLSISQPLSAGQARTYHAREFTSNEQNYWSRDQQGHSEWQGRLAGEWGLSGAVGAEHFARLSEGQHPQTEAQLVRHQTAKTYDGKFGREVTSVEHRAGWDAVFSAPKSVSLTALVGGDDRVRVAHRESVRSAMAELERYTQARIGNIRAPETTGKFAAATFEHDTARPVEGYAAPQLHTHAVIFNVTERENGQTRALQPQELFASQSYATNVYRSELAVRLKDLGYTIERGEFGQPEIKGYTKEYLEANSLRREQVKDHMRASGLDSPAAAQIAAHRTRDSKQLLSPEEVLRQHRELAAQHGHQADRVVAEARQQGQRHAYSPDKAAQVTVTYARDHLFERSAVESERSIMTAALGRSMGEANFAQVRQEFERRVQTGEFRAVEHGATGQRRCRQGGTPRPGTCAAPGPNRSGSHLGGPVQPRRRAALQPKLAGDRHSKKRVCPRYPRRCAQQPAHRRAEGRHGTKLRSTAPAGGIRLPRAGAGFLSGRPSVAHRALARLEAGQP